MLLRISSPLFLLLVALFLPFWLFVILALAGMAYFPFFIEAVAISFLVDLLYGAREPKLSGMIFVSFSFALISFIIIELFKKKLR